MFERVLARRGHDGYRQYRIPALARLGSGRLLAVYDGRATVDDLPGPIDLVARHSDDNGRTWSPQRPVRSGEGYQGFGDPSLLVDHETRRVFCFHAATERAGFFESRIGHEDLPEVEQCGLAISDDQGENWRFERITPHLKTGTIAALFAASGAGIQVDQGPFRGRLLQPFVVRLEGEGLLNAAVAYSDDHGDSWHLGELIPGGNESALVSFADGSVLLHSRDHPRRTQAWSTDGGVTFTPLEPVEDLPDPSDNGSLVRLQEGQVLICTHNAHESMRVRTVVRRSDDRGNSWSTGVVLCAGSSGYSTAVELPGREVGVLYEREGYSQLVFAIVSLDDFVPLELEGPPLVELSLRMISTPTPQESSAGFAIPLDDGHLYDSAAWREVSAAQSTGGAQVIHTRAELDDLLGKALPGLNCGDELFFSLSIAAGAEPMTVLLETALAGAPEEVQHLRATESRTWHGLMRRVTQQDVDAGQVEVEVLVDAGPVGQGILRQVWLLGAGERSDAPMGSPTRWSPIVTRS